MASGPVEVMGNRIESYKVRASCQEGWRYLCRDPFSLFFLAESIRLLHV